MIDGVSFSDRGERVTDLEVALCSLTSPSRDTVLDALARRLVADYGPAIGSQVLATVLDEIGGTTATLPGRRGYFARLWRVQRAGLMAAMAAKGYSPSEIARQFGVSRPTVWRVLQRCTPLLTCNAPASEDGA